MCSLEVITVLPLVPPRAQRIGLVWPSGGDQGPRVAVGDRLATIYALVAGSPPRQRPRGSGCEQDALDVLGVGVLPDGCDLAVADGEHPEARVVVHLAGLRDAL